jgi:hypothetical protein
MAATECKAYSCKNCGVPVEYTRVGRGRPRVYCDSCANYRHVDGKRTYLPKGLRSVEGAKCKACDKPIEKYSLRGRKKQYCSAKCRRTGFKKYDKVCISCRAPFRTARVASRYCSSVCANKDRSSLGAAFCSVCSEEFEETYSGQQCCSLKCASEQARRTRAITQKWFFCQYCGVRFKNNSRSSANKYCTRECAFADKKKYSGGTIHWWFSYCKHCYALFRKSGSGQFCSDECRKKRDSCRARDAAASRHDDSPRTCAECGHEFCPEYGKKRSKYCSFVCLRKRSRRIAKQKRRAIEHGSKADNIDPIEIFRRDGWKCHLCGRRTPKRLRGTCDEKAPELDHILPLSKGGDHTVDNVACACRSCNIKKSGSPLGQMILPVSC